MKAEELVYIAQWEAAQARARQLQHTSSSDLIVHWHVMANLLSKAARH